MIHPRVHALNLNCKRLPVVLQIHSFPFYGDKAPKFYLHIEPSSENPHFLASFAAWWGHVAKRGQLLGLQVSFSHTSPLPLFPSGNVDPEDGVAATFHSKDISIIQGVGGTMRQEMTPSGHQACLGHLPRLSYEAYISVLSHYILGNFCWSSLTHIRTHHLIQ